MTFHSSLGCDLCYNTVHELQGTKDGGAATCGTPCCGDQQPESCIHVLPQLLGGIAWAPLQDGLQEMRVLFELLGFLLKTLDRPFLLTLGFQDSQACHGELMPKAPSPIYNARVLFDLYR
jgi:hypothetical protein